MASGPTVDLTKLLGSSVGYNTQGNALTTGADGAVYVAGYTQGNLDGQVNQGGLDAFITKYNPDGTKVWTKLLGNSGYDNAFALTTGADGDKKTNDLIVYADVNGDGKADFEVGMIGVVKLVQADFVL